MIIGIDFSIRSTAVCIFNFGKYKWISLTDNIKWDLKPYTHHNALKDFNNMKILSYDRTHIPKKTKMTNDEVQVYKMENANIHSKLLMRHLSDSSANPVIGFEGFSYGSKGNSFIDLIVYNAFLKKSLMDDYHKAPHIVTPKALKKWFTGNGNAEKIDMFNAFIESKDPVLIEDPFYIYCKSVVIEKDQIPKPIEDLVDSYAVCKYLQEFHQENS